MPKRQSARYGFFEPAASTDIAIGDLVSLNSSGLLVPATKTNYSVHRVVGIADEGWSVDTAWELHGSGDPYTTPSNHGVKIRVISEGVCALPIAATSGTAGDAVYLSTATSGSMDFTLTQPATAATVQMIGRIEEDFSGATSGDKQGVVLMPTFRASFERDLMHYLQNHVIDGLQVHFDCTSLVCVSAGAALVGGKLYTYPYTSAAYALACASHASKCRVALYVLGSGGTRQIIDTGNVKFTLASAGTTDSVAVLNSKFWPTFSGGVVIGAGLVRSGSSNLAADRVRPIHRTPADIAFRKSITGNPI